MSGLQALAGLMREPEKPAPADKAAPATPEPLDLTQAPFPNLSSDVIRQDIKTFEQIERGRSR